VHESVLLVDKHVCLSATPTNCGNTLKLYLPSIRRKILYVAGLIALGMVKTIEMTTMGNPQPSPKIYKGDAVQRLDVGGVTTARACC